MSVIAAAVRHMLASGMSPDIIVSAVADMEVELTAAAEAKEQERLLKQRERTRLSRERRKALDPNAVTLRHVTEHSGNGHAVDAVTLRHVSNVTDPLSPKTKAPTPPKTQPLFPQESIPKGIPKNPQPTPRIELETVLDIEHAEAVIDHRRQLRPPLSVRAAKLLAGKFARCADPNAAADAMIANGWRGFEPEWLENRIRANSTGPPRKLRGSAALSELASRPISEVFGNTFDEPSVNPNGNFAARNGR